MSNPSPSADSKWQLDPSEAQKWKDLVSYDEASVDLQGESLDSVTDVNSNKILQDYAKQPDASPEVLRLLQDIKELSGKADETKKEMENESAFDRYTSGDIRWVRAVYNSLAEVARSIRDTRSPDGGKIARYQKAAQASLGPNGDQATFDFSEKKGYRVAIVGDVGTCDDHQDEAIKRAIAAKADIICHLGDIYYCGTSDECADFWDHYDKARGGSKVPLFSIPGNHEYISGGGGFFNALLPNLGLTDRGRPQLSSFFCLRFPASGGKLGVQIIGLDTGLNTTYSEVVGGVAEALHKTEGISETKLSKEELAWLESRLQDKKYQTILLTHHQPRSPHWNPTTLRSPLWVQLQPVLVKYPEVKLWLWGHEHRIRIYTDTYLPVKANESDEKGVYHIKGRCVGNSSMPERVPTKLLRVDEPSAYYHLNDGDCIATNLGSSLDGIYNSYTNCAYALVTIGEGGDFKVEYNRVMWDPSKPNVDPILYTDKFGALPK